MPNLPFLPQLSQRADRVLERNLRIDPVQLIEIDPVELETPQARLARLA